MTVDVTDAAAVAAAIRAAVLAFGGVDLVVNNAGLSISKPLLDTTEADWDLQHDVMAKGSFLVSREAARVMIAQGLGGDIVYISRKNSVFAGPNNVAYGAAKADQAHQVRLLAAELGEHGIRVNGINPDGVVRGSGIFAGGWGAQRAAVYGVAEAELGAFYAQRTLLKREVLPEHVAAAVFALDRRGPVPDDRPAHPGRRRRRGRVPAMTARTATVAAVDLGASSGRVVLANVGPDGMSLREVHRFPNTPVRVRGVLRWDVLALWAGILDGLRAAGPLDAVGVDGWGVDYALLDADGELLGDPAHYRDPRTAPAVAAVLADLGGEALYAANGTQLQPFNTMFQLMADRGSARLRAAANAVLIPDLMTYWLSGALGTELTNASTTGLLDPRTRDWAGALARRLDVPIDLFPPLRLAGEIAGTARADTGLDPALQVVTVPSHDTASAVAGVPAEASSRFAYVCTGTWALVGVELPEPVMTEAARESNFTNEIGVDGSIRFLRNVTGFWLLQECVRAWRWAGLDVDAAALTRAAADVAPLRAIVDVQEPGFAAPDDMPARVCRAALRTSGVTPSTPAEITRCVIDSMAVAVRHAIADAVRLSGRSVDVVHIVGGGVANALFCQAVADACGRPVIAGPVEAASWGNAIVQARALGIVDGPFADARALIRAAERPVAYRTVGDEPAWRRADEMVFATRAGLSAG